MNALRSIAMAFAMFSRIPMPRVEWKKENMRYMLCALPLVGAAIGLALTLWVWVCLRLKIGQTLFAAGIALIPLLLSGGIHMDGFCDTADALSSHQPAERKREILKDSHAGAFAVISFGMYMLGYFALSSELELCYNTALIMGLMHMISRAVGALMSTLTVSAHEGLLSAFTSAGAKGAVWILLCIFALCAAGVILIAGIGGAAMVIAAIMAFFAFRRMAIKQFGGMSGDLAGFSIQMSEIIMLTAYVFVSRAVNI